MGQRRAARRSTPISGILRLEVFALLSVLAMTCAPSTSARADDDPGSPTLPTDGPPETLPLPTIALEDSLPEPTLTLPETVVHAPRASLDEILRRIADGEKIRDAWMKDQSYDVVFKVLDAEIPDTTGLWYEYAAHIYKKLPDKSREIPLRRRGRERADIALGGTMGEEIVGFAFDPSTRSKYDFEIRDRYVLGDHLVYRIAFAPKSALDGLPNGEVWVDTNEFVILREVFSYPDQSPAPFWIESFDSCVIERTRVDGRWWVLSRVMARLTFASPIRAAARLAGDKIPKILDVAYTQTNWEVNRGLPDSLFVDQKPPAGGNSGVTIEVGK